MGVKITEILAPQSITLKQLKGKVIAIDAYNHLYQFLSSIRSPSGDLLTDSKGRVTSHLLGLFSRTTRLMQQGIKPIYIFDGKPPELKRATIEKRRVIKERAREEYEIAKEQNDIGTMRKQAARTSRLSPVMVEDAKKLLELLGVPHITAPSEGEAQAARLVVNKDAYAVGSQDADTLLFGAERLVRNLSISRQRKKAGTFYQQKIDIQLIELTRILQQLNLSHDKLIALAMLVGTDYAPGVSGLGPKKAHKLVNKHQQLPAIFEEAKWTEHNEVDWQEIFTTIKDMPVRDDYSFSWEKTRKEELMSFLHEEREFSKERIESALQEIDQSITQQQNLMGYFK